MTVIEQNNGKLFSEIKQLIEESRQTVAKSVNSVLTGMYWNIGSKINTEILNNKRADYGKKIIVTLSHKLTQEFGKGWSEKQLRHCLYFVETFPDLEIVSTLWRQLSWSHFKELVYLKTDLERDFYTQMSRIENWSVRELRKKIDSMLFERTAISKKPDELIKLELKQLKEKDRLTPDLVFRDPYVLDFLNLKDTYLENDFEKAIIQDLEKFILELGVGFTFVARQKRMLIDGKDFSLDLLFFHRKLKRLVAIELKPGKFKAEYKGKMELYLRWLEKHETETDEEQPIGLILCAGGNKEQMELLQLDKGNIKVAKFITKVLPKEVLAKKLHLAIEIAKDRMHKNEN